MKLDRRHFIGAALAGIVGASILWRSLQRPVADATLTVSEAHAQAKSGEIVLVDIRRPDEWKQTGIGEGAHPLDMRDKDFVARLDRLAAGKTVALICATGGRSAWLTARLTKAGMTQVMDVPEGMLGSRAGPGWLRLGLPVRKPEVTG